MKSKKKYLLPFDSIRDMNEAILVLKQASENQNEARKNFFKEKGASAAINFISFPESVEPVMSVDMQLFPDGVTIEDVIKIGSNFQEEAREKLGIIGNTDSQDD